MRDQCKFQAGDIVRLSAAHLRSICPNAHRGWPTTEDPGRGIVIGSEDIGGGGPAYHIVEVEFSDRRRKMHESALVDDRGVYMDAMNAEHLRNKAVSSGISDDDTPLCRKSHLARRVRDYA